MMPIYTRTGDDGASRYPGGRKARKDDPRLHAVGAVDELNAHIGWCLAAAEAVPAVREALDPVQKELFVVGATIGASLTGIDPGLTIGADAVARMERRIDAAQGALPELRNFILPRGPELTCRLHVTRTVCRRAERALVAAANRRSADGDEAPPVPPAVLVYVNRLSDLLFALARAATAAAGQADHVWRR